MTQDEIIRMAREADMTVFVIESLERFAALVAANEREKWEQALPIAMDAMMLQEREACAKVCEERGFDPYVEQQCAEAIRARGKK